MKLTLKKMVITHFKGCASRIVVFGASTQIAGANKTGKSTIMDAFLWCLFGKNSDEDKEFGIKPRNEAGEILRKTDNVVEVVFDKDGEEIVLKRTNHEKWQTKRGALESEYTGDESLFEWNGVPQKAGEFAGKVAAMIGEADFKLLTNPMYFNTQMKWQDRRAKLVALVGEVVDSEIVVDSISAKMRKELLDAIAKKGLDGYKAELLAKRKKIGDALKELPTRIDEARKGVVDEDWEAIKQEGKQKATELQVVESQITDRSKKSEADAQKVQKQVNIVSELTRQAAAVKNGIANDVQSGKLEKENALAELRRTVQFEQQKLVGLKRDKDNTTAMVAKLTSSIAALDAECTAKRTEYATENARTIEFKEDEFVCPCCHREFEANDIETKKRELTENWNKKKSAKLEQIKAAGVEAKKRMQDEQTRNGELHIKLLDYDKAIAATTAIVEELSVKLASEEEIAAAAEGKNGQSLEDAYAASENLTELLAKVETAREVLADLREEKLDDTADLQEHKRTLSIEITALRNKYAGKENNERIEKRVAELEEENRDWNAQYGDIERILHAIGKYEFAKMDMLEERINELFKWTKFRLFDTLVDGTRVPACITLVRGVDWSDANTASKLNAGLDIINTFSAAIGVSAPIFIDNRESVTNIIPVGSQVINLIVDPSKKELEVTAE